MRIPVPSQHPSPIPALSLSISAHAGKSFVPFLRRYLRRAHALLRRQTRLRELSVALVGDAAMSRLHERFMGIAGPTDVLTFPLELDARGRALGGEVIVNVAEARRRARERGHRTELEVLLYAIHGLLHLSGFDDRTDRGFAAMHRMEDQLLMRLGLGAVFDRTRSKAGT